MTKPIISADSHVCEPPDCYAGRIDPKYRDRAPVMIHDEKRGDVFRIEGSEQRIPLALVSAAGKSPEELSPKGAKFEKLHRGGWDPPRPDRGPGPGRDRGGDAVSVGGHGDLQHPRPRPQAGVHGGIQPVAGRVLRALSAPAHRPRPGRGPDPRGRHPRARGDPRPGVPGGDAPPASPGARTTTTRCTGSSSTPSSISGSSRASTSSRPARGSGRGSGARGSTASCRSCGATRTS